MTRFTRLDVLQQMRRSGLVPLFSHDHLPAARQIVAACAAGGATTIEFTNRTEGAWRLFADLLAHCRADHPQVMLGIGSVVDAPTAALFLNLGADFVVGPTFNPAIATLCNRRKVAYIPGCATLTEISTAEAAGAELVKVFPGSVVGPGFVRAVRGPQPWSSMLITGGVQPTEESIGEWFAAGATAVGLGSGLIRADWIAAGQYEQVTALTRRLLGWIATARGDV